MGERVNCNDIQDYIRTVQSVREQSLIEEGQRRNLLGLPSPFKGKQKQEGETAMKYIINLPWAWSWRYMEWQACCNSTRTVYDWTRNPLRVWRDRRDN